MAHAGVDHLGSPRRRSVALAVAVRAQERAALDHLSRHPELWLPRVVAGLHLRAARVARNAARGRIRRHGVTRGIPVGGPLPDVPGHVEQAVRVRGKRTDLRGMPVTRLGPPREVTVPEVGQPLPRRLGITTPHVFGVLETAARRGLPLAFRRQSQPGPRRILLGVLVRDVDDGMVVEPVQPGPRSGRVPPGCAGSPGPPEVEMAKVDRPAGPGEDHRPGLEVRGRSTRKVRWVQRSLGHRLVAGRFHEGAELRVGDLAWSDPEAVDGHRVGR